MRHITGISRQQRVLFPESVEQALPLLAQPQHVKLEGVSHVFIVNGKSRVWKHWKCFSRLLNCIDCENFRV